MRYLDPRSGATFPLDVPLWRAPDGGPLMLTEAEAPTPARIAADALAGRGREDRSLWRYRSALPALRDAPITLGEGGTPLVVRRLHGLDVWLKCEWANPTGSFKDRGASVMLSLLHDVGVREVLEDSSGNGGAAVAAYAAAGGMRATILAPEGTSPAKTFQARAYGASVELIPGDRQATSDAALNRSSGVFYASHAWQPFFLQGTKTIAYELWEDLGRAPDNVIMPCGGGSIVLGCAIGFSELLRAGAIATLPRLWAVQPEACAPIARAFMAGPLSAGETVPEIVARPTIAEGTAIARPVRQAEVLAVLRECGGGAVMLGEEEIAEATLGLAREGILVEPTCAQAVSALRRLIRSGAIEPEQTTVVVLTGSGLKAAPLVERLMAARD